MSFRSLAPRLLRPASVFSRSLQAPARKYRNLSTATASIQQGKLELPVDGRVHSAQMPMKVVADVGSSDAAADMVVFPVFENAELNPTLKEIDTALGGALQSLIDDARFVGKMDSSVSLRVTGQPWKCISLLGVGKKPDWRKVGAAALRASGLPGVESVNIVLPDGCDAQPFAEGVWLAGHKDRRFEGRISREKYEKSPLREVSRVSLLGADEAAVSAAKIVSEGVVLARELVNAPANVATPSGLVAVAQRIAEETGLECTILDEAACRERKMGAFLAVGACSKEPSYFIHLSHKPENPRKKLAFIGKGLTFDAGGYNLKVGASSIEMMKMDMGGAAAVLGAASVIGRMKPDVEVHFLIATCENMVSGAVGALHPGDIITASDGTTIEVNNTDAEGRLTLADAILYARELKPDGIVDVATLTGACIIALGSSIGGVLSNSEAAAEAVLRAGREAGEPLWRLPLEASYRDQLKSDVADLKNCGIGKGGTITAALFLNEFVPETLPWVHMDIAGPVIADKASGFNQKGGTGFGVRTLVNHALQ